MCDLEVVNFGCRTFFRRKGKSARNGSTGQNPFDRFADNSLLVLELLSVTVNRTLPVLSTVILSLAVLPAIIAIVV